MFTASFGPSGIKAEAFNPTASDPVRVFPDSNLEGAVRTAVGVPVGDIHQSDLDKVTSFDAYTLGIVDLTGMEYWTTLVTINLYDNDIVDVSPLASLTSLETLNIYSNKIVDVSPLASLTSLTTLDLGTNSIVDISSLASLIWLTDLNLSTNSIVDISALAGLTQLVELYLDNNSITDCTALPLLLSGTLDISGNTFSSEDSYDVLYDLEALGVLCTYDPDPDPALNAPNASAFTDANLISAIQVATSKTWFRQGDLDLIDTLDVSSLGVGDLTGMEYWTTLVSFNFSFCGCPDLTPLANLTSLEELLCDTNGIVSVAPLALLTALTNVSLDDNNIADISAIAMTAGVLSITSNPLNAAAYATDIPALIAAGVTVDYDPAWRSPDGFVDTLGSWSDEAKAYDGNTATYAYVAQNLNMWCNWVRFTFSAPVLTPSQFRIWMSHEVGATPKTCHVKAYDGEGGEETLINTGIDEDEYVTVAVSSLTKISYFEVRFEGQTGVTFNIYVNEVGVYGS